MSTNKRVRLNVSTKYELIQDKGKGVKISELATKYGIVESTIRKIIKEKDKIRRAFESNIGGERKSLKGAANPELERTLIAFVTDMNARGGQVSQDLIQVKARDIATKSNITDFQASRGFFQNFKKRNSVAMKQLHGDSTSVDENIVNEWKKKIAGLTQDYSADDVFNLDELGLFYQLVPSRTFAVKGSKCLSGKKSKLRITVLLGSNCSGTEKLKPLVIGKFAKPHCLRKAILAKTLPVFYEYNRRAWVTSALFQDYLSSLNNKFMKSKRNVIIFLDNCPAHPHGLIFSNIKLVFLPANTTLVTQPMDMGIIKCFKDYYKKRVMRLIINELECNRTFLIKDVKVNLSHAISYIDLAWKEVTANTINNCFKKAGFDSVTDTIDEEEVDNEDMQSYWNDLNQLDGTNNMDLNDYLECDNQLAITGESAERNLEIELRAKFHQDSDTEDSDEDDDINVVEDIDICPSLRSVLDSLNILRQFSHSVPNRDFNFISPFIDKMERVISFNRSALSVQTKVTDFFTPQDNV